MGFFFDNESHYHTPDKKKRQMNDAFSDKALHPINPTIAI